MKDVLVYSQVYSILNLLGNEFIEKLPKPVYDKIIVSKSDEFVKKINSFDEITPENIDKEAIALIAFLHINYWSDAEEKLKIKKILINNFEKNEEEKRKKYSYDDIFKNSKTVKEEKPNQELVIKRESTFKRIVNKIFEILHIEKRI